MKPPICSKCEISSIQLSILKEQLIQIKNKYIELQRINNTLLNSLKTCQDNQDWKIKYQKQVQRGYEREKERINNQNIKGRNNKGCCQEKCQNKRKQRCESNKQNKYKEIYLNQESANKKFDYDAYTMYSTPKVVKKSNSIEKMTKFMTNLKKNITQNKTKQFFSSYKKLNSYQKYKIEEIMDQKLRYSKKRTLYSQKQQKNKRFFRKFQDRSPDSLNFNPFQQINPNVRNISKRKTFMQILTF